MREKAREYIHCAWCDAKVEKRHYAQRFCVGGKCRNRWHNEERLKLIQAGREAIRARQG